MDTAREMPYEFHPWNGEQPIEKGEIVERVRPLQPNGNPESAAAKFQKVTDSVTRFRECWFVALRMTICDYGSTNCPADSASAVAGRDFRLLVSVDPGVDPERGRRLRRPENRCDCACHRKKAC